MKFTLRRSLSAWFTLAIVFAGASNCPAAAHSEAAPAIHIHVRNYAGVDSQTLAIAEQAASRILLKAGVRVTWAEIPSSSQPSRAIPTEQPEFTLADVQLTICTEAMSNRLNMPENVMGLTPGMGLNRQVIYVFDAKATAVYWRMIDAHARGTIPWFIPRGQVLGHAIAHEMGHLLLNQPGHSDRGIMRGEWGFPELRDATFGDLLFTPQQAAVLQTEVRRRCVGPESAELN